MLRSEILWTVASLLLTARPPRLHPTGITIQDDWIEEIDQRYGVKL